MTISAFYRTSLPMVAQYTRRQDGDIEEYISPIVYMKGNVQPWKKGESFTNTQGGIILTGMQVMFTRATPVFSLEEAPTGAQWEYVKTFVFDDGQWLTALQKQNWTKAGRNVKHYKWFVSAASPLELSTLNLPQVG